MPAVVSEWSEKILAVMDQIPCDPEQEWRHGLSHAKRVLWRSLKIAEKCDKVLIDIDVLTAAALLHDISKFQRNNSPDRALESALAAKQVLDHIGFPKEKISRVTESIMKKNSPSPDLVRQGPESRILHDADKLDCFGPIGIVGWLSWGKRRNLSPKQTVSKLVEERILEDIWNKMNFKESKELAINDYDLTLNFFDRLHKEA